MSFSNFTGRGKVIYTEASTTPNGNNYFRVNVSVPTGQPKGEADQYPPSNVVSATFWGNQAKALAGIVDKGVRVILSGKLGVPYVREGNVTLQIYNDAQLDIIYNDKLSEDSPPVAGVAVGSPKQSKAKAKKESVAALDDDDDEELYQLLG